MVKKLSSEELEAKVKRLEREVAEMRQREEAFRTDVSKFRAFFEAANVGYLIVDEAGTIVDASSEYIRLTGHTTLEEIKGKSVLDWTARQEITKNKEALDRCLATGFIRDLEISYADGAGNCTPVEINAMAVRTPDGKRILTLCRDISERKRIEKSLQDTADQYRELVDNANSIILRMNVTGNVTYFNEFARTFFGYEQKEILGRSVVGTIVPEKETTGRDLRTMIEDIGKHPERYTNNENENMRKDGTRVWIAWTNKPIYDATGQIVETLCIGNDITPRKNVEKALRESEELFKALAEDAPFGISIMCKNQGLSGQSVLLR
ncbi:MAG: PAS domain-containing protein [Deltaproteobacteria bacterium]|nr:PAS domain-containing protein [Deltaproteobacteria bacterium]